MSRITLLQSQERLKISKAMTDTASLRVAGLVVLTSFFNDNVIKRESSNSEEEDDGRV